MLSPAFCRNSYSEYWITQHFRMMDSISTQSNWPEGNTSAAEKFLRCFSYLAGRSAFLSSHSTLRMAAISCVGTRMIEWILTTQGRVSVGSQSWTNSPTWQMFCLYLILAKSLSRATGTRYCGRARPSRRTPPASSGARRCPRSRSPSPGAGSPRPSARCPPSWLPSSPLVFAGLQQILGLAGRPFLLTRQNRGTINILISENQIIFEALFIRQMDLNFIYFYRKLASRMSFISWPLLLARPLLNMEIQESLSSFFRLGLRIISLMLLRRLRSKLLIRLCLTFSRLAFLLSYRMLVSRTLQVVRSRLLVLGLAVEFILATVARELFWPLQSNTHQSMEDCLAAQVPNLAFLEFSAFLYSDQFSIGSARLSQILYLRKDSCLSVSLSAALSGLSRLRLSSGTSFETETIFCCCFLPLWYTPNGFTLESIRWLLSLFFPVQFRHTTSLSKPQMGSNATLSGSLSSQMSPVQGSSTSGQIMPNRFVAIASQVPTMEPMSYFLAMASIWLSTCWPSFYSRPDTMASDHRWVLPWGSCLFLGLVPVLLCFLRLRTTLGEMLSDFLFMELLQQLQSGLFYIGCDKYNRTANNQFCIGSPWAWTSRNRMKTIRSNKIARCKVPNLLHLADRPNVSHIVWPKFFSKVQNSLKLLEGSAEKLEAVTAGQGMKEQNRKPAAIRIKQLSRRQVRSTSLPHKLQALHVADISQSKHNTISEMQTKILTLPRVDPQTSRNPSPSIQIRNKVHHNKTLSQRQQRHKSTQSQYPEFQSIASATLVQKSFQEILNAKEEQQFVQGQHCDVEDSADDSLEVSQGKESQRGQSFIFQQASRQGFNFKELSTRLAGAQPKMYENYDRKLMEKVKLYRPRKFKISHQFLWRL